MAQVLRVAVAHDYLTQMGGAERVALELARAFPGAPLYTSLYSQSDTFPDFASIPVNASRLNRFRIFRKNVFAAFPLLPFVWRARAVEADVVLCSSSGWSHAVRTSGKKIVYCHNPPRWIYQVEDVRGDMNPLIRAGFFFFRWILRWLDRWAASTADVYIANSSQVSKRIEMAYGRTARILHPPVSVDTTLPMEPVEGVEPGYFLTVGRDRGYKNVATAISAVELLGDARIVWVGGSGTQCRAATLFNNVSDAQLRWLYANCRALIALSHEDFGLTVIEANAFGKPVVALKAGGYLDSVIEGSTGVFASSLDLHDVVQALRLVLETAWDPDLIREHASRFSVEAFRARLRAVVGAVIGSAGPVC